MGKVLEGDIYHHYFVGKRSHIDDEDCVPEMTDNMWAYGMVCRVRYDLRKSKGRVAMETYYMIRVKIEGKTMYVGGPEFTPWFEDAFMFKGRFMMKEIGRSYKKRGYEVDICELEFKGSYEV